MDQFNFHREVYAFCYKYGNNNKGRLFPSLCFLGNGGELILMQRAKGL